MRSSIGAVLVVWTGLVACGGGGGGTPVDAVAPDAIEVDAPALDAPAPDAPVPDAMTSVDAMDGDALVDGGSGVCDPLAPPGQQGCAADSKCTWIRVQETPVVLGVLGCVPDGTVTQGGACTVGPAGQTTGYDDCAAGLVCINATCADICGFDGSANAACASGYNCTRYAGLFANGGDDPIAGACNPSCDPVTQVQTVSGLPCGTNRGCYLLVTSTETVAVCAGAGATQHDQDIVGTVYANSCVPGAQPRTKSQGSTTSQCGGLCRPADVTSTANMADEAGVAPDACTTRWGAAPPSDATAGESCRYWWAREAHGQLTPYSNSVGWCFKHAVFQYDSDLDGTADAPFPRCTTLTTGDVVPPIGNPPHNDARYFWCAALPTMFQGGGRNDRGATDEPQLDRVAPAW